MFWLFWVLERLQLLMHLLLLVTTHAAIFLVKYALVLLLDRVVRVHLLHHWLEFVRLEGAPRGV